MHGETIKFVAGKSCRKSQNTHFCSIFFKNRAFCEIMWKNIVRAG